MLAAVQAKENISHGKWTLISLSLGRNTFTHT